VSAEAGNFDENITRFLRRVYPDFTKLVNCQRLTGGANQETYRIDFINGDVSTCCALRRAAGGLQDQTSDENIGLANEALLIQIAEKNDIPVPSVIAMLEEQDELGAGFLMPWLNGETHGARIVRQERFAELRKTLAFDCGVTLAKIHAIDVDKNQLNDLIPETTPESFIHATWSRYKNLNTPQPMLDYAAMWLLDNLPKTHRRCLVHNDFRNGNLMVDENGIVAVLDWEIAHIGDPYRDLGWLCTKSWCFGGSSSVGGFGEREDLFDGYESISGESVDADAVKFWEVFGSFWWGVGCLMMAEQYRNGPDPSVERPGIGRRSSECQMDCVDLIMPGQVEATSSEASQHGQLPTTDELLKSVAEFLREQVMHETQGRVNFLARVAANSLEIVRREISSEPEATQTQVRRLTQLLDKLLNNETSEDWTRGSRKPTQYDIDTTKLKWRLVEYIRHHKTALVNHEIQHYLRQSVYEQLSIDQPKYPAFVKASVTKN